MNKNWKLFIFGLISALFLVGLAACGNDDGVNGSSGADNSGENGTSNNESTDQEDVEIRFSWWGDTDRNELYNEIVDRFEEQHPHITVSREFGGWEDYWDRLATQIAGGNAPDVVSMHQFYVSDYARRNALLNLNDLIEANQIDLSDFPESAVDSGKVDDEIYMVAKGITMSGYIYNTAVLDELGVEYPDMNWTWDDFVNKTLEINEAFDSDQHWGMSDMSGGQLQPNFRYFVRQQGKDVFNDDGEVAFDEEDLINWWSMWDELRQAGAIPDASTMTEFEGAPLEQNLFNTERIGLYQIPANQIYLYQEQFEEGEVQMVRVPTTEGGENGEFIEGAFLSIAEESNHPEAAAEFIDFFVNAEEAIELFKVEQGPPAGEQASELVLDLIDPAQARAVEFIQEAVQYGEPSPYAPAGINEVEDAFSDNAEAIAFGQKTIEEAAEDFMNTARSILQ